MSSLEPNSLAHSTILIVGIGGRQKYRHYQAMRNWGCRLILVCSELDPSQTAAHFGKVIVVAGLYNHQTDDENAEKVVNELSKNYLIPDGVLTLWEDCAPLASRIALTLGLPGVPPDAALKAKSKFETQVALSTHASHWPDEQLHVQTMRCSSKSELDDALRHIGLPAILKLEHGSSAAAVVPVATAAEAFETWTQIMQSLQTEHDWPGIGLGFGTHIVLCQLLTGTEHDVDIVVWEGELVSAFVTDNGLPRSSSCAETSAIMPTQVSTKKQKTLVSSALSTCRALGLSSGVFNIEVILTTQGARVIDVNGRMGGFYIRDWINHVWTYDILWAAALCSIGVRPEPSQVTARTSIAGAMLLPMVHGVWLSNRHNIAMLRNAAESPDVILNEFEDTVHTHDIVDEPWGNLATKGRTPPEAVSALLDLWHRLGLAATDPGLADLFSFNST